MMLQDANTNQLLANEIWPRRTRKTPFKTTAPAALSYKLASSLGPAHSSQKPARAASSSTTSCGRRAATMEVEPPPLEERRRLQEELSEFVESCCRTLEEVTASLGWSLDQLDPGDEAAAEVREAVAWPFRSCGLLAEGKMRPNLSNRSIPVRCRGGQGSWGARSGGAACGLGDLLCHLS